MPPHAMILPAIALALAACVSAPTPSQSTLRSPVPPLPQLNAQQQRGHDLAVRRCSGCHTVGLDDGGAQEGPAFYKLARRTNPIALERRFAEVSAHGFARMPPISFTPSEAEDLVAYFATLAPE